MAKKRVHEIAKQRGMPSKEVIAILQKAGLDVKTAAQSIDENDIEMAFSNGQKAEGRRQKADGGAEPPSRRAVQPPSRSKVRPSSVPSAPRGPRAVPRPDATPAAVVAGAVSSSTP